MVTVVPTLQRMADIYRLPREGGAKSARFTAYHKVVGDVWGMSPYNPMAGPHAFEAVEGLLALGAEAITAEAAREVVERLHHAGEVTLAVVLAAPGMWTDRVANEVRHRTIDERRPGHGIVLQWTRELPTREGVRREAMAEAVRVAWTAVHGPALRVRGVLAREGLAYAMDDAPFAALAGEEERALLDALDIMGDTTAPSEIVAIAHGDDAAVALGYSALGLAVLAGVRWASARARAAIAQQGAPRVLATWATA